MKILIDMGHPGHVHFFKNFIWEMQKKGHTIIITAINKDVTLQLLEAYNFSYIPIGSPSTGIINLIKEWMYREIAILKISRTIHPDILMGIGNPVMSHIGKLIRRPSINFTDTEHANFANHLTFPFSDVICTPACFLRDIGNKQVRYNGYHELAYLHPNRFTPNPAVLTELGLSESDPFIIVRFVSWNASHDVGQHGIQDKIGLVKALEQYGRVLITSEGALPPELQPYQIGVSPEKLHDLLYYATLYVGEGATTASECAVLGTHAIYVNTLRLGYTDEEGEKYGLVYTFSDPHAMETDVLNKALDLLNDQDLRVKGKHKRRKLLEDKIDVTAFMIWFIENYPRSLTEMKEHPEVQYSCASVPGDAS